MEHIAHGAHGGTATRPAGIPTSIHFGKFKGWPIREIESEEKYVRWLLENDMVRLGIALAQQPWLKNFLNEE